METGPEKPAPKPDEKASNAFIKYSGMAFQMMAVMLIAAYGGQWLDGYFQTKHPWFTLVLLLIGAIASVFITIRTVTKQS